MGSTTVCIKALSNFKTKLVQVLRGTYFKERIVYKENIAKKQSLVSCTARTVLGKSNRSKANSHS